MVAAARGEKLENKVDAVWKELQDDVNHVLDREIKGGRDAKKVG